MFRKWAFWRRVQYGAGFLALCTAIAVPVYLTFFVVEPSCTDGIMNGDERGVDCGGSCFLICAMDVVPPTVVWAQAFEVIDGQYNAVAYIENKNREIGTAELTYTFTLSDDVGVIIERSGTTVLPPDGVYPIFEGRIQTGDRVPTKTAVTFGSDAVWRPGDVGREQFRLEQRELRNADSLPRLVTRVTNTSLDTARDVEIVAVIFDSQRRPLTASRTQLDEFIGRTTEEIVFTWPHPIAKTLRSCEIPSDVMLAIDLSGSMNNDGGNPPEPVTSVLRAAQSFVSRLKSQDQVGVVTYATDASLKQQFTNNINSVADLIGALAIDPASEQGSTNTGDAIVRVMEEFSSARHDPDARKVAIILTDGLATAPGDDPEGYALTKAAELKESGVTVFTIGLGAQLNRSFLEQVASGPEYVFIAPTVAEVDGVYRNITSAICEDGPSIIEVIAKPETSFR